MYLPTGCATAVEHVACVDPISVNAESPNCRQVEKFTSCTKCEPCYEMFENGSYPNNELGDWSNKMYGCIEVGFNIVGTSANKQMYEYRYCGEYVEYRCRRDSALGHIYPNGREITCNETINADGTIKFGRVCSGCSKCNEESGQWKNVNNIYQQYYQYKYQNVAGNYCPLVAQNKFRCGNGYYGNPTSSATGCTQCPTIESSGLTVVDNPTGKSVVATMVGATKITECYATTSDMDTLITLSDGKGNFYWAWNDATEGEGRCYYK